MASVESAALTLYEFLKAREHLTMTSEVIEEIKAFITKIVQQSSDARLKEVLRNFGWKEGVGFHRELDIEGLCVAVRRSQLSTSFLRVSILYHQDSSTSFVPEILMNHLSDLLANQEFGIRPFSKFEFGACLLVDISGFTKLSSYYCARGADGIDELQKIINGYLGELAAIIYSFGGDIIKYAGDAVLCLFPGTDPTSNEKTQSVDGMDVHHGHNQLDCCQLAILCALHLKDAYTEDLSVHVAVTCGEICFGVLGGHNDKFECLISGPCLQDLSQCLDDAKSKEVVISAEMVNMYSESEKSRYVISKLESGNYLLASLSELSSASSDEYLPAHTNTHASIKSPLFNSLVAQFVPEPINQQLYSVGGGDLNQLAELREVTTMFIKWQSYDYQNHRDLLSIQDLFYGVQQIIFDQGGFLRQFLVDDKGCVCIALWGVPSASHIDNAYRAVTAATGLQLAFHRNRQECSIGITTGKVFTGTVGSALRKEYAAIGDSVNMAARLMSKANGEIYLDYATASKLSKSFHDRLKSMGKFAMKGKAEPMEVYSFVVANAATGTGGGLYVTGMALSSSSRVNGTGNSFSHIRPQVLQSLKMALDGILAMHEEASVHSKTSMNSRTPSVSKHHRQSRGREISLGGLAASSANANSIHGGTTQARGKGNTITNGAAAQDPASMALSNYFSMNYNSNRVTTIQQQPDEAEMAGLGHMVLLEGKTEFEKMNIIAWLKKECSELNFNVKEIDMIEEDRQFPLELWRKVFREVIGIEICDDIDQLECYFFPLLKDLEPDDPLFVDEIAIPILCAIFRIHNASLNHSYDAHTSLQYRGLKLHHLPSRFVADLVRNAFDRIMQNHVRTVFIIHNLQFVHEESLKILLQTQAHPIFHIFFATSSLSSLSVFRGDEEDGEGEIEAQGATSALAVGDKGESKDPKHREGGDSGQGLKGMAAAKRSKGMGSLIMDSERALEVAMKGRMNGRDNDYEIPRWIRHLLARIANVDIITLGPYSVDDIKLMLAAISGTVTNSAIASAMTPGPAGTSAAPTPTAAPSSTISAIAVNLSISTNVSVSINTAAVTPSPSDKPPSPTNRATNNASTANRLTSYRAELATLIHQLSDGNAFWVEEFVGFIAEAGVESFMKTIRKGSRETNFLRRNSNRRGKDSPGMGFNGLAGSSQPGMTTFNSAATIIDASLVSSPSAGVYDSAKLATETMDEFDEVDNTSHHLSTLEAFIICRLERLPVEYQKIAKIAAILGYRFSRHVLYGVLRRRQRNLMFLALQSLVDSKWITKLSTDMTISTTDYKFNHPLLQSTLYQLTPATDRRELHRKAGRCMIEVYGEEEPRIYGDLIEHFAEFDHHDAFRYTIKFLDYHLRAEDGFTLPTLRYLDLAITFASHWREIDILARYVEQASALIKVEHKRPIHLGGTHAGDAKRQGSLASRSKSFSISAFASRTRSQRNTNKLRVHAVGEVESPSPGPSSLPSSPSLSRYLGCLSMGWCGASGGGDGGDVMGGAGSPSRTSSRKHNRIQPDGNSVGGGEAASVAKSHMDDVSYYSSYSNLLGTGGKSVVGVDSEEMVELLAEIQCRFRIKKEIVLSQEKGYAEERTSAAGTRGGGGGAGDGKVSSAAPPSPVGASIGGSGMAGTSSGGKVPGSIRTFIPWSGGGGSGEQANPDLYAI